VVPNAAGHRIFVVHGHDEAVLHDVARFLERLGQDLIILREQPNQGRTVIEKFENYADVGFAVVLLTADDRGGPVVTPHDTQTVLLTRPDDPKTSSRIVGGGQIRLSNGDVLNFGGGPSF